MAKMSEQQKQLLDEYAKKTPPPRMRKMFTKGVRGGAKWPLWVVQLICELLVIGVPPNTIRPSITTVWETIFNESPEDVPALSYIRQCRVVVQILGETLAAMKLADADLWKQLSTDATTRRHIPFQCLIISVMADEFKIDPVIVSSCIYLDEETAEATVDSLFDKVCAYS